MFFYIDRVRTVHPHSDEQLTEQSHADSCDIHNIMRKYEKTGLINHLNLHSGTYGDYTGAPDFHSAMNLISNASSMFESVPSKIRAQFDNDPGKFLAFMQDEKNRDAIIKMGFDDKHLPPLPASPVEPMEVIVREPKTKAKAKSESDDTGAE